MGNLTITNIDTGNVVLRNAEFDDDTFTAAGAATLLAGTILARDSSTGKLVVFEKGGTTNENGIPKAVITYDVVSTGAGDYPVRVLTGGVVRKQRLVIDADGDDTNVDQVVKDQLRDYATISVEVDELLEYDNQ